MKKRNQRIWTALAMAVSGYVTALILGAGAAFVAMLGVGVASEVWFWSELIRRWWEGSEPTSGTGS